MSNTPILLPFRFFNFDRKNKFLKIVQQKGFEIASENQTVLSAKTKWWMSQWFIDNNSYSTSSHTENIVAYDISIKKILDDEDKKYINLLAEYLNYWWEKYFGFIEWVILGYILGFIIVALLALLLEILPFPKSIDTFIKVVSFTPVWIAWPAFYIYFYKKDKRIEGEKYKNYQTKLKPYLQGISF